MQKRGKLLKHLTKYSELFYFLLILIWINPVAVNLERVGMGRESVSILESLSSVILF